MTEDNLVIRGVFKTDRSLRSFDCDEHKSITYIYWSCL